jgi:uncharacterized protein (TIRG00374 family)
LAYVGAAVFADAATLKQALMQLGVGGTALVLALSLVNYLLRFQRWHFYIARLGYRLQPLPHLLLYLGGFAFTVSPAKAGEAVRSLYLRDHGVPYAQSIAALFVERILDLLAMAVLASLIVFDQARYWPIVAATAATAMTVLLIVGRPQLPQWIEAYARRHAGRVATALAALGNLLQSSQRLLTPRVLLLGIVLGVVSWGAEGIGFHLVCRGLQLPLDVVTATGIYAIAALAGGAAFFMPGGIGGMEVVMTALLVARGAPLPVALIATLVCRLATLWFAVLIGLAAAALLEARSKESSIRTTP